MATKKKAKTKKTQPTTSKEFKCPSCGNELKVRKPEEGKLVTCKKCGTMCEIIKKRRKLDLIPLDNAEGTEDLSDLEVEWDFN